MVAFMSQIQLFALASQQAGWLSVRQSAIADNIANANTPGFKPADVEPFEKVYDKAAAGLRMAAATTMDSSDAPALTAGKSWATMPSGNAVSLEQELIKADEVNRAFALNTGVVKAFHRLLMLSVK